MPQSWHFLHLAGNAKGVSKEIPEAVLRKAEQDRKDASGKIFAISFSELLQGPAGQMQRSGTRSRTKPAAPAGVIHPSLAKLGSNRIAKFLQRWVRLQTTTGISLSRNGHRKVTVFRNSRIRQNHRSFQRLRPKSSGANNWLESPLRTKVGS